MKPDGWGCETLAEVREQVGEFLQMVTDGRIMCDPERRRELVRGLGLLYLRMDLPEGDLEEAAGMIEGALNEYTARVAFIEVRERSERCDSD